MTVTAIKQRKAPTNSIEGQIAAARAPKDYPAWPADVTKFPSRAMQQRANRAFVALLGARAPADWRPFDVILLARAAALAVEIDVLEAQIRTEGHLVADGAKMVEHPAHALLGRVYPRLRQLYGHLTLVMPSQQLNGLANNAKAHAEAAQAIGEAKASSGLLA